jgi:hypothetical protein
MRQRYRVGVRLCRLKRQKATNAEKQAMPTIHKINIQRKTGEKMRAIVAATAVFCVVVARSCVLPSNAAFHCNVPNFEIPVVDSTSPGNFKLKVTPTA